MLNLIYFYEFTWSASNQTPAVVSPEVQALFNLANTLKYYTIYFISGVK